LAFGEEEAQEGMDAAAAMTVDAAQSILPWLDDLLGDSAEGVRRELLALLARAARGEDVANEILAVLGRESSTREWARRFLEYRSAEPMTPAAEAAGEAPEPRAEDAPRASRPPIYRGRGRQNSQLRPRPTRGGGIKDPPRSAFGFVSCPDRVVVGQEFELTVGLSKEQQPGMAGGELVRPESSFGPYVMTIKVDADGFDLREGQSWHQELDVTYETPYPVVTLHPTGRPQTDKTRRTKIEATYSVNGQTIGLAVRYLTVGLEEQADFVPGAPEAIGVDMGIPSTATAPDLTIKIRRWASESGGRLRWDVESPHGLSLPEITETDIGHEPQRFAEQLVADMNVLEGRDGLYRYLLGVGKTVADEIPVAVWEAVRGVAAIVAPQLPTILLLSQEPYVPWELAVLDPPLDTEAPPFLAAQAVVGRWILDEQRPPPTPPADAGIRSIAVVWGIYDKVPRWRRLEEAEGEAKDLMTRYGAKEVEAATPAVLKCLEGDPVADLLHFAVHGKYDPDGVEHGLALVDGQMLRPMQVKGFDLTGSPFVFLNACQVGSGEKVLGDYAGMAEAFLYAGASAVVAPLWSVKDAVARSIASSFYERTLGRGERPAEVLRDERKAFSGGDRKSATYLAYQFFGHPMMKLDISGLNPSPEENHGR
jgi:hypothetical protein